MEGQTKKEDGSAETATILFVDDEQNILSSLRRLFRQEGYRLFIANGGTEGLAILEKEHVDLIVSDMRMPHMDGAEFLEQAAARWPKAQRMLLTGYADINSTIAAINKGKVFRYISKPWNEHEIKLTVKQALEHKFLEEERARLQDLTRKQNEELASLNATLEKKVKARTEELEQTMNQLEETYSSLKKSYIATVKVFANIVEVREGSEAGHSRRVAQLTKSIASKLGMVEADIHTLLYASLLHDIGKISLPDHLLNKPFNQLPREERDKVLKHPAMGQTMLMSLEPLQEAGKIIKSHHERFDGRGYPDGLAGNAIPLGARILALANDFDSLQIGMINPQRLTESEAIEFIKEGRGKRYDPAIVDIFLELKNQPLQEQLQRPETRVTTAGLKSGMILSRDFLTKEGILLLGKDHALDDKMIARIQSQEETLGIDIGIYVYK